MRIRDKTIKLVKVLLDYWIWLVHRLKWHQVSLILSHTIRPRIHKPKIWILVWVINLILNNLLIVEVDLHCWEIIERVKKIVALIWHKPLVIIWKISSMGKV